MQIKSGYNLENEKIAEHRQFEEEDDGWIGESTERESTYRVKEAWAREKEMENETNPVEVKQKLQEQEDNEA